MISVKISKILAFVEKMGRQNWMMPKFKIGLFTLLSSFLQANISNNTYNEPEEASKDNDKENIENIETDYLHIILDHKNDDMEAIVLKGPFANQSLSRLSCNDIIQIRKACKKTNYRNILFLEKYLDKIQPNWRQHPDIKGKSGKNSYQNKPISLDEARAILGLTKEASHQEIRQAHRNLMKKFHPDQGGSNYLAARINEAKDYLLKRVN